MIKTGTAAFLNITWKKMQKDLPTNVMRRNDDSLKNKCL